MRIGIAGFGKMGSAFTARLLDLGNDVFVWNRELDIVAAAGVQVAPSPKLLAEQCDYVISSLFDSSAVDAVYRGEQGLIAGGAGTLFIEMSTVRPQTQIDLARDVAAAGGSFIECPVSGTTIPARNGQLVGLAGGSAEDIERARVVLEGLCRRIQHIGPIGAGATAKLAINLPLLAFWQSFGEAMAMMKHLNKDPKWLLELFSDTAGAPAVLKVKAPAIEAALRGQDAVEPTFDINAMRKDLRLILEEAKAGDFPLPVAGSILGAFDEAASAGWGQRDCAWVPAFWASKAHEG